MMPPTAWISPPAYQVAVGYLGKWYLFWAGGVRLFLAGLRQTFQPGFTLRQIFEIDHKPSEHIVGELGFANLSMGLLCMLSLPALQLAMAGAIVAGLYYGLAGLKHVLSGERNANRTLAMATDILVLAVLAATVVVWLPLDAVQGASIIAIAASICLPRNRSHRSAPGSGRAGREVCGGLRVAELLSMTPR